MCVVYSVSIRSSDTGTRLKEASLSSSNNKMVCFMSLSILIVYIAQDIMHYSKSNIMSEKIAQLFDFWSRSSKWSVNIQHSQANPTNDLWPLDPTTEAQMIACDKRGALTSEVASCFCRVWRCFRWPGAVWAGWSPASSADSAFQSTASRIINSNLAIQR